MVKILLALTLVAGVSESACRQSVSSDRQTTDERIGRHGNAAYAVVADDGLLHVRNATETTLRLRATAPAFALTLERRAAAAAPVLLTIENLSPLTTITEATGALAPLPQDPATPTTRQWTVSWPAASLRLVATELPAQPFVFLAMADIQDALPKFDDMVDAMNAEPAAEFILMAGDLTESAETEQFDEFERRAERLTRPFYATPGNHDTFVAENYQARFGRASYSFRHRGIRFSALDSASADVDAKAFSWLEGWLEAGRGEGHVLFTHIPAIEYLGVRSGQWNSRRLARHFLALAAKNQVDLLLYGHIHSYDHYESAGIPTYISGGGGAIPEAFDRIGRHYLRVEVDPAAQRFTVTRREID